MKLTELAIILTDDCNFDCSYCRQMKEENYMKKSTINKTVDFFYPFLTRQSFIVFYGGEPLLAYDNIEYAVSLFEEKKKIGNGKENEDGIKNIMYRMTTNGSLMTDAMLDFFNRHHFHIMISFDGVAQDISRQDKSFKSTIDLINKIRTPSYANIDLATNSVFAPGTVKYLSQSLQTIMQTGLGSIRFDLDKNEPWDDVAIAELDAQLEQLTGVLIDFHKETGDVPLSFFHPAAVSKPGKGASPCTGGRERMAVTPDETVWGCLQFHDYAKSKRHLEGEDEDNIKSFSFGQLGDFMINYKRIHPRMLTAYDALRQDRYFAGEKFCFLCEDVEECFACPVCMAYSTGLIGELPPWYCGLVRTMRKHRKRFHDELAAKP